MAGNKSPELLQGLNDLIAQISGSDSKTIAALSKEGISGLLEQMLKGGFVLPISRIKFETLREQIEAEEAALKSL